MEKKQNEMNLKYCEYVDSTFITFRDAIQRCMGHLSSEISACTVFDSDFQKSIALLNYLNTNYQGVCSFLEEYQKLEVTF